MYKRFYINNNNRMCLIYSLNYRRVDRIQLNISKYTYMTIGFYYFLINIAIQNYFIKRVNLIHLRLNNKSKKYKLLQNIFEY